MNRPLIAFSAVIAVSTCTVGIYYILKKRNAKRIPKEWVKVGNVLKLYAYPLKSGRFIEQDKLECTKFSVCLLNEEDKFQLRDRSFIVYGEIDLEGKSARIYPSMVLITISSTDKNHVSLNAPEMDPINFEVPSKNKSNTKTIRLQSWSDEHVTTIDCGDEVSRWLSNYLLQKESGLRLGYHHISSYRSVSSLKDKESLKFYKYMSDDSFGLYSDLTAGLLVNEKSVQDLNEKLENKVLTTLFRPNIVVDGDELSPFAEDDWLWLKINDVVVRNVRDCTRCVLTTVNPETGIRDLSREPLKTLSKYRISSGPSKGPIMGVHIEVVTPGIISVGDEIFAGIE